MEDIHNGIIKVPATLIFVHPFHACCHTSCPCTHLVHETRASIRVCVEIPDNGFLPDHCSHANVRDGMQFLSYSWILYLLTDTEQVYLAVLVFVTQKLSMRRNLITTNIDRHP
jgi:hypothetical protein